MGSEPTATGDFIRDGMDKLIDAEFNKEEDKPNDTEKTAPQQRKAQETQESDDTLGNFKLEDDETTTEDDTEGDKIEEEEDKETEEESGDDKQRRSVISTARAEFKEVFKKYPELEKNYFVAKEYESLFSHPKEAEELVQKNEYVDKLIDHTFTGDPAPLFETLYEADKEGFVRFAMSFLPTLNESAPKLAEKIIEPVVNNLFAQLGAVANERGDENLLLAVKYCIRELTGRADVPDAKPIQKFIRDKSDVEQEKEELNRTAEVDFYTSVERFTEGALQGEISKHLSDKADISEGIKEVIMEKVLSEVYNRLKNDDKHNQYMLRLKKMAQANRYSVEYKRKVARAVFDAASNIIPEITRRVEQKVVGNVARKRQMNEGESNGSNPRRSAGGQNLGGSAERTVSYEDIDFKKTSLRDALDAIDNGPRKSNVVLKRRQSQ